MPLPTKSAAADPRPAAANDQQRTLPYFASAAAAEATAAPGKAAPQADTEAPRNLSRQELVQALRHLLLQLEEPPDTPEQSPSDKARLAILNPPARARTHAKNAPIMPASCTFALHRTWEKRLHRLSQACLPPAASVLELQGRM